MPPFRFCFPSHDTAVACWRIVPAGQADFPSALPFYTPTKSALLPRTYRRRRAGQAAGFALRNSHELRRQAAKLARPFRPHPELDRRKGSRLRRRLVARVRPDGRAGTQRKENLYVITRTQNPHRQPLGHDLAEQPATRAPGTPSTRAAATRRATRPGRKRTASASTTC